MAVNISATDDSVEARSPQAIVHNHQAPSAAKVAGATDDATTALSDAKECVALSAGFSASSPWFVFARGVRRTE